MSGANHRDPELRKNFDLATHVKHGGRVVDLFQMRWIGVIVEREDLCSRARHAQPFFLRLLQRLARRQRLRGDCVHASRFQFR